MQNNKKHSNISSSRSQNNRQTPKYQQKTKSQQSEPLLSSSFYQNNFNSGYQEPAYQNPNKVYKIFSNRQYKHNESCDVGSDNQTENFVREKYVKNGDLVSKEKEKLKSVNRDNFRFIEQKNNGYGSKERRNVAKEQMIYNSSKMDKSNAYQVTNRQNKTSKQKSYKRPTNQKAFYQIQIREPEDQMNYDMKIPSTSQNYYESRRNQIKQNTRHQPIPTQFFNCNDFVEHVIRPIAQQNTCYQTKFKSNKTRQPKSYLQQYSQIKSLQNVVFNTLKQKQDSIALLQKQISQLQQQQLHQFHLGQQLQKQLLQIKKQRQLQETIDWTQVLQDIKESRLTSQIKTLESAKCYKLKSKQQVDLLYGYQKAVEELDKLNKKFEVLSKKQKEHTKEELMLKENLRKAFKVRRDNIKSLSCNKREEEGNDRSYRCEEHLCGQRYSYVEENNNKKKEDKNKYAPYLQHLMNQQKIQSNKNRPYSKQNSINLSNLGPTHNLKHPNQPQYPYTQAIYNTNPQPTTKHPPRPINQTQLLFNLLQEFKEIKQKVNSMERQKKLQKSNLKTNKRRKAISFRN